MSFVVGLLLVVVVAGLIGLPLMKRPEELDELEPAPDYYEEENLEKEKENVLTALSELEYDYHMNKISEDDYRSLKARLTKEAVAILKDEEGEETGDLGELELAIEKEVERELQLETEKARRQLLRQEARAAEAAPPAGDSTQAVKFCLHCGGRLLKESQKYCHLCGEKLES